MLDQVLENEAMTGKLVDDLVERMLTGTASPPPVSRSWQLAPVIPILHGILAIATFLLIMLAAIAAVTGTYARVTSGAWRIPGEGSCSWRPISSRTWSGSIRCT